MSAAKAKMELRSLKLIRRIPGDSRGLPWNWTEFTASRPLFLTDRLTPIYPDFGLLFLISHVIDLHDDCKVNEYT